MLLFALVQFCSALILIALVYAQFRSVLLHANTVRAVWPLLKVYRFFFESSFFKVALPCSFCSPCGEILLRALFCSVLIQASLESWRDNWCLLVL